jgi:hypothetical protein
MVHLSFILLALGITSSLASDLVIEEPPTQHKKTPYGGYLALKSDDPLGDCNRVSGNIQVLWEGENAKLFKLLLQEKKPSFEKINKDSVFKPANCIHSGILSDIEKYTEKTFEDLDNTMQYVETHKQEINERYESGITWSNLHYGLKALNNFLIILTNNNKTS